MPPPRRCQSRQVPAEPPSPMPRPLTSRQRPPPPDVERARSPLAGSSQDESSAQHRSGDLKRDSEAPWKALKSGARRKGRSSRCVTARARPGSQHQAIEETAGKAAEYAEFFRSPGKYPAAIRPPSIDSGADRPTWAAGRRSRVGSTALPTSGGARFFGGVCQRRGTTAVTHSTTSRMTASSTWPETKYSAGRLGPEPAMNR